MQNYGLNTSYKCMTYNKTEIGG